MPMLLAVYSVFPPKNTKILSDYDYNKIEHFRSLEKIVSSILTLKNLQVQNVMSWNLQVNAPAATLLNSIPEQGMG